MNKQLRQHRKAYLQARVSWSAPKANHMYLPDTVLAH